VTSLKELRRYRNTRLYRTLGRVYRVYNRMLLEGLHARGFEDVTLAFAQVLSNVDTRGTRIGVLAERAGVTRQAAGQLVAEVERAGYVERSAAKEDARAVVVRFTPRGKKMLATVFELVESIEEGFAQPLAAGDFERLRLSLAQLADRIDARGSFGAEDET
jgi:DNA-binding MarR family transcriptional regulator